MQRFSHWETVHYPGQWRGFSYYYPYSVSYPIYEYYDDTADQIAEYEKQRQLTLTLKRKVDAEAALLESYVNLALQRTQMVEFMPVLEHDEIRLLSPREAEHVKQLTHQVAMPMQRVR